MTQQIGPMQRNFLTCLRSGNFTKIQGHMRRDDCFCALGVLCSMFEPEWKPWQISNGQQIYGLKEMDDSGDGHVYIWTAYPPSEIKKAVALTEDGEMEIQVLNDSPDDRTFEEIADIIEFEPSRYFSEPR